MKPIFFFFTVLLIAFLFACKDDLTNADDYSIVIENHTINQYKFPSGVYYSYTFENENSHSFNEVAVLDKIKNNGIKLNDAWYKSYSSSCTPPGSNISMMVIVPAEFLIRVNQADNRLNDLGFTGISDPDISFCSYSVKHYIFK